MRKALIISCLAAMLVSLMAAPAANAIHWYRGPGSGCTPATGEITDQPNTTAGPLGATVELWHDSYADGTTKAPVTKIKVGESVRWTWNSAHCHSVTFSGFGSGLHYPQTEPTSPRVVPGFFDYPVLESSPTLAYTHTFTTPGRFTYSCVHHALIGMVGVIEVEA